MESTMIWKSSVALDIEMFFSKYTDTHEFCERKEIVFTVTVRCCGNGFQNKCQHTDMGYHKTLCTLPPKHNADAIHEIID